MNGWRMNDERINKYFQIKKLWTCIQKTIFGYIISIIASITIKIISQRKEVQKSIIVSVVVKRFHRVLKCEKYNNVYKYWLLSFSLSYKCKCYRESSRHACSVLVKDMDKVSTKSCLIAIDKKLFFIGVFQKKNPSPPCWGHQWKIPEGRVKVVGIPGVYVKIWG